jgi:hypothetical protein
VTSTGHSFDLTYLDGYKISTDSVDDNQSIAFEFSVSDASTVTCGNMNTDNIVDQQSWEIGTCTVIPVGFLSGWSDTSPYYLVSLQPYILCSLAFT